MSDLISRSALIEAMNASKKQPTSDANIEGYCEGWNDLADIINSQPTAYDVDFRNKAIDDFVERLHHKIKSEIDDCADELDWIDEIAKQLKAKE